LTSLQMRIIKFRTVCTSRKNQYDYLAAPGIVESYSEYSNNKFVRDKFMPDLGSALVLGLVE